MKGFHPVTLIIFYTAMVVPLMLVNNPIFTSVSLVGALIIFLMLRSGGKVGRELSGYLIIFIIMSLVNPLFVHRGSTPLFFLNGKAITKEALLYGINSSLQLVTAVIWCRGFSVVMTSDRLFCLTGKLSPKISAMLTMAVRFIPDMLRQAGKISAYSRISGEYNMKTFVGRVKRILGIFSALVTWSIESAVQTADSMKARGFELGGRTSYSKFRFAVEDGALIILSVISCAISFVLGSRANIVFYPTVYCSGASDEALAAAAALLAAYIFPAMFSLIIGLRRKRLYREREAINENT